MVGGKRGAGPDKKKCSRFKLSRFNIFSGAVKKWVLDYNDFLTGLMIL
jgi:hypothetical protein